VRAQELIRSTTAWDGGPLAWPDGTAEVRAVRITMAGDATTPWHCHPVPTFGYMLSGELEVRTEAGQTTILRAGDAVIEVFRTWHTSRALGGPVDLVAFYAGAVNQPDTVLRADGGNCDPPEGDDR
jgi:quercetin dioxygenase-like cupin family protein